MATTSLPLSEVGSTFGSYTVVSTRVRNPARGNRPSVVMEFTCGSRVKKLVSDIAYGRGKACRSCAQRGSRNSFYRHGDSETKLYRSWRGMHRRCTDPKVASWPSHGGRGITVCDEWRDYEVFKEWAESNEWKPGMHLHRINNDSHYSPDNCKYVTPEEHQQIHAGPIDLFSLRRVSNG